MLSLGCLPLRSARISADAPSKAGKTESGKGSSAAHLSGLSAWLLRKVKSLEAPHQILRMNMEGLMFQRLYNMERKRPRDILLRFTLVSECEKWIEVKVEAFLIVDVGFFETGNTILVGNSDFQFFFEHVFCSLRNGSTDRAGECGVHGCTMCMPLTKETKAKFRLDAVFESISANQHISVDEAVPRCPSAPIVGYFFGKDVPEELIERILDFLPRQDLRNLSKTCRWMRYVVPRYGLNIRLYEHQERAVERMLQRERNPGLVPLLNRKLLEGSTSQTPCHVDLTTGSVNAGPVPLYRDHRGGLFCDEPGLGKTVTGLALILRTLGAIPQPPKGERVFRENADQGWKYQVSTSSMPANGRLVPLGSPAKSEGERRLSRVVKRPDYLNPAIGVGSVPFNGDRMISEVYLSGATLIVVPRRLIHHWKTQIEKHVRKDLLRICILQEAEKNSDFCPARLAFDYDIILTTLTRMKEEYGDMRSGCPMFAYVRFLRIIIDEGHALGGSLGITNLNTVCQSINAERKWIMTGTPTPNTLDSDIRRLRPLLRWLNGKSFDNVAWIRGIERPYEAFKPFALQRVYELLNQVLIRASKKLIPSIPKCEVKTILIDFSPKTSKSYNDLVTLAQRNMLLADWYCEDHEESILNPKNHKSCLELLSNIRMACCFAGLIRAVVTAPALQETLDALVAHSVTLGKNMAQDSITLRPLSAADAVRYESCDSLNYYRVLRLRHKDGGFVEYRGRLYEVGWALQNGCTCDRCQEFTRLPFVTPCAHLLCNSCVLLSKFRCTVSSCGLPYAMEKCKCKKKLVPHQFIELQAPYENLPWLINWERSDSAKLEYLVRRILEIPNRTIFDERRREWETRRPKMIVFSQFKEHLYLASMKLSESPLLEPHLAEAHQKTAKGGVRAIGRFRTDPEINILLMDARFAEGHDLSMVEYIFLLDPIWDYSLENQVISRAHRMGAESTIYVEKLVVRNSVEHEMTLLRDKMRELPDVRREKKSTEATRRATLLKALHVVSTRQDHENRIAEERIPEERIPEERIAEEGIAEERTKESEMVRRARMTWERIYGEDSLASQEDENESNASADAVGDCSNGIGGQTNGHQATEDDRINSTDARTRNDLEDPKPSVNERSQKRRKVRFA